MKNIILFSSALLFSSTVVGQRTLDKVIGELSGDKVPLVAPEEVAANVSFLRLDARELEEYEVSHLPEGYFIGYDKFDAGEFETRFPDKDATYVVYCSVGIRSGKIGERLQQMGYSDVRNLAGGIFKWVEEGNEVLDKDEKVTQKVHAYNRFWGILLNKGEKVYGPVIEDEDEG